MVEVKEFLEKYEDWHAQQVLWELQKDMQESILLSQSFDVLYNYLNDKWLSVMQLEVSGNDEYITVK